MKNKYHNGEKEPFKQNIEYEYQNIDARTCGTNNLINNLIKPKHELVRKIIEVSLLL
jgi:hypothetical protein